MSCSWFSPAWPAQEQWSAPGRSRRPTWGSAPQLGKLPAGRAGGPGLSSLKTRHLPITRRLSDCLTHREPAQEGRRCPRLNGITGPMVPSCWRSSCGLEKPQGAAPTPHPRPSPVCPDSRRFPVCNVPSREAVPNWPRFSYQKSPPPCSRSQKTGNNPSDPTRAMSS